MASGGVFKLTANEGKTDKMIMATGLLLSRIQSIINDRTIAGKSDITPTLKDIEQTHILYMNAHFKPHAAIGYEYSVVQPEGTKVGFGSSFTFSIPQFGDFFHDMVCRVRIDQASATAGTTPVQSATSTIFPYNANGYSYNIVDHFGKRLVTGVASGTTNTVAYQNFVRYCEYPGHRLFSKVKFDVNGNPLDEYTSDVPMMLNKFTVMPHKRHGHDKLVGQQVPLTAVSGLQSSSVFDADNTTAPGWTQLAPSYKGSTSGVLPSVVTASSYNTPAGINKTVVGQSNQTVGMAQPLLASAAYDDEVNSPSGLVWPSASLAASVPKTINLNAQTLPTTITTQATPVAGSVSNVVYATNQVDYSQSYRQIVNGPQTPKAIQPPLEIWNKLRFWFNDDVRLSVPSVSIPFGQRFITITTSSADKLLYEDPSIFVETIQNIPINPSYSSAILSQQLVGNGSVTTGATNMAAGVGTFVVVGASNYAGVAFSCLSVAFIGTDTTDVANPPTHGIVQIIGYNSAINAIANVFVVGTYASFTVNGVAVANTTPTGTQCVVPTNGSAFNVINQDVALINRTPTSVIYTVNGSISNIQVASVTGITTISATSATVPVTTNITGSVTIGGGAPYSGTYGLLSVGYTAAENQNPIEIVRVNNATPTAVQVVPFVAENGVYLAIGSILEAGCTGFTSPPTATGQITQAFFAAGNNGHGTGTAATVVLTLDAPAREIRTYAPYYQLNGIGAPAILTTELYINNIFVNPEIHDIFIKRIGFSLIRVYRQQRTTTKNADDQVLLHQLKWPIEYMYAGYQPAFNTSNVATQNGIVTSGNANVWRDWHRMTRQVEATLDEAIVATTPISGSSRSPVMPTKYYLPVSTVDNISLVSHGIPIYNKYSDMFFTSYAPFHYGDSTLNTSDDTGAIFINMSLFPRSYQPSGHLNISRVRETYLQHKSSYASSASTMTLIVVAIAINFLLISDGSAVLRYST